MPNSQPIRSSEEGIDLNGLFRVVFHRRWWVLAFLALCLSAGVVYVLIQKPVYEANTKLRIGQIADLGPFEPAEVLASRLLAQHGEDIADGIRRRRPFLARAAAQRGIEATVELVAEGYRPDDTADFLSRLVGDVQRMHTETYRQYAESLAQRLKKLDGQRAELLGQYDEASALLEQTKVRDPVQASILAIERSRILALISELDTEKPTLMLRLSPPQTRLTVTLGEIIPPASPARPRKALVLGLAALLGLVGGVMLALAIDVNERPSRTAT